MCPAAPKSDIKAKQNKQTGQRIAWLFFQKKPVDRELKWILSTLLGDQETELTHSVPAQTLSDARGH